MMPAVISHRLERHGAPLVAGVSGCRVCAPMTLFMSTYSTQALQICQQACYFVTSAMCEHVPPNAGAHVMALMLALVVKHQPGPARVGICVAAGGCSCPGSF